MKDLQDQLIEARRRLGPFTGIQRDEQPWRVNQAELARRLVDVIEILMKVVERLPSSERSRQ